MTKYLILVFRLFAFLYKIVLKIPLAEREFAVKLI